MWHGCASVCVTWLVYMCEMICLYVWCDLRVCVYVCVCIILMHTHTHTHTHRHEHTQTHAYFDAPFVHMWVTAHMLGGGVRGIGWRVRGTGWLRLVGSLKLQVSIGECSVFSRALLQKRPMILRSLLIVAIQMWANRMSLIMRMSFSRTNTHAHTHTNTEISPIIGSREWVFHTHTHAHTRKHTNTHTHTHKYTHTHTHIHTHPHTHTNIHTPLAWTSHVMFAMTHMCGVPYSYVCRDSFICVQWYVHMFDATCAYVCVCVYLCARVPCSYIWRDSFIYVQKLILTTHLQDSFKSPTWGYDLGHFLHNKMMWDTHSHDPFTRDSFKWPTWGYEVRHFLHNYVM